MVFNVYRRHAHIFWIPLFPLGKIGLSECKHCKNVLRTKEMPDALKMECKNLKSQTKGPIWQFAGLALIAILIGFGAVSAKNGDRLTAEYLATPAVGDLYKCKLGVKSYSTMKVTSVSKDSIFVCPNAYEINKMSRVYKIDKPENYAQYSYGIARGDLKEMYDSGEIYDVSR